MAVDRDRAERAIEELLRAVGKDPSAAEWKETAARVARAWAEDLVDGEDVDVEAILRAESFETDAPGDLVVLRRAPTATMCPHHLLPAVGFATVAYVPDRRVAGLGTLARVVDAFAHRLTLQEEIGRNVVSALAAIGARGAACTIELRHTCLVARGERKDATIRTLATSGVLAPGGTHAHLLAAVVGESA